jgi:hypothetical protein
MSTPKNGAIADFSMAENGVCNLRKTFDLLNMKIVSSAFFTQICTEGSN